MVPHKVLVSKRLAQCLNPSLPSGVHQKALEVYTYIFGLIKVRTAEIGEKEKKGTSADGSRAPTSRMDCRKTYLCISQALRPP